jgi:hypothetical protein
VQWIDVQVGLLAALLVAPLWLLWKERNAFKRLLRAWGFRIGTLEDEIPEVEAGGLVEDVQVVAARGRALPGGELRVEVDLVARSRLAKRATVKLGLLDPAGVPYPVPAGQRWAHFDDHLEAPGGEVETSFATLSEMRWQGVGLEIPPTSLPAGRIPPRFQLRVEVWIDGRKEAAARLEVEP